MSKKPLIVFAVFLLIGVLVYGVGAVVEPQSGIWAIYDDSPCPVVQCANGECHGFDNVPVPDGIHEMTCPEAGCSSADCHAWDTLANRYHQASDASLNVWVLIPAVLVTLLVLMVKRGGRNG